ncbi:regulator of G-protein signaling 14 isoform X2 [Gouania willdenowi]|uniref:Regulator of G-protein signaling 14-like n=1 Tax=Gouania willdenowi TaxID=441366 RepID=A0A8C5G276_GOUWI|nr:regulator of G-protein signaling 14-like isoform X2 [Gouania willdenowi]
MAKNCNVLGIPGGHMSQAVSDGVLNMSARSSGGSSSSLPGTPGGEASSTNSVLSWAVSFEKLLEDPSGVQYFMAFLKSEVSVENMLFWQACENFKKIPPTCMDKLKTAACAIYNTYLSDSAFYTVNIDDTARIEQKDLEQPSPGMFTKAQAQIFKLMKMDSYRRFVRSPLYQSCTLASVGGKHLPQLSTEPVCMGSWEDVVTCGRLTNQENRKSDTNRMLDGENFSQMWQKRGSWGNSNVHFSKPRKDSLMSVKSTSSAELGSLSRQIDNDQFSPCSSEHGGGGGASIEVGGGYCCVYLPDGTASLAPTRSGQPIKEMLTSLCEKRGFPLKDVIIYLQGKEKQPLSLDQDCSILRDKQVSLELRVMFALEITCVGKTVGIMVKSSKTLQDALSAVMLKHNLKPQETLVTLAGSDEPLNLSDTVFRLANKTLRLDRAPGKDQSGTSRISGSSAATKTRVVGVDRKTGATLQAERGRNNREMDGFLEMLTRAQGCRVDDQRGLLTKEQLEIPPFLQQIPGQERDNCSTSSSVHEDSSVESEDKVSLNPGLGEAVEEPCGPTESESKHLRETTV